MEAFSADWLALREPADHDARAHDVAAEMGRRLGRHTRTRALDLASGTGSNVRYLLPRLPSITRWTLVDHDAGLLDLARRSLEPVAREVGVTIETAQLDLRRLDALPIDECALITASALLDLVSADWLAALARRCQTAGADALFSLSYDGRIDCDPADAWDERLRELVNRHQRRDKGFGPALGPDAVDVAKAAFGEVEILVSTSDWVLDHRHAELQRQLLAGWASAARAMAPADASAIDSWLQRRLTSVVAGRSRLRVGHRDLAAWKSGPTQKGV
jgi:SAM-dependent methyltransferase